MHSIRCSKVMICDCDGCLIKQDMIRIIDASIDSRSGKFSEPYLFMAAQCNMWSSIVNMLIIA